MPNLASPFVAAVAVASLLLTTDRSCAQQHAPATGSVTIAEKTPTQATFSLRWPNSWRNQRNHDGAWIVLRGADPTRGPLRLAAEGHGAIGKTPAIVTPSQDGLGVFVAPAADHRGDVEWQVTLQLAEPAPSAIEAWAVGMVLVPAGAFELGDDDARALRFGAFHRVGSEGKQPLVFPVADEAELTVAATPGALWYARDPAGYQGDQSGPIPAAWPKGTRAFWIMKHELTQGEYARFVDAMPTAWRERRIAIPNRGEEAATFSLDRDGARIVATAPNRPCNFVSWDDTCAFADWMALRPMTEFEFEKAARGPQRPVAGDYPWGTADAKALARQVTRTRDLAMATIADEAELTETTRAKLGASHYWVMDLAGSLWERVVSAGHPAGRAFLGSHGDGVLSTTGGHTNADWPSMDAKGAMAAGVGFRGGAEYFATASEDDPTNPQSRTAVRTYAGWGGAHRTKTYSARAVRSVDAP